MHCRTTAPPNLHAALGEAPVWCLASDLDGGGRFGRSFLILGPTSVLGGDATGVRVHLRLAEIKEFVFDELPNAVRILARRPAGDQVVISASPEQIGRAHV